jgi:hypothetical protein
MPPPPKFGVPELSKFIGNDGTSTIKHVSWYMAQLGVATSFERMEVRLFSLSLSRLAFGWYTSL